jgi:ketosteroid isomerase-like protein
MRTPCLMLLVIAATTAAAGCAGREEPRFGVSETKVIRQRTADFAAAFNAKETDKVLSFYSSEIVFMPPNSPILRGKDALRKFYDDLYGEGATELRMESVDVGGHGPLAYESGTFSINRRPPTGPHTRDRGKYLFIWRNTNGRWLNEYTMWSSDLPERVDIAPVK